MKTITIFGSSAPKQDEEPYMEAYELGTVLAKEGFAICNGGYGGTMEASAKGARAAGGHTIGITCSLFDREPNAWIIEKIHTSSLEERLRTLVARGDGFVLLPGGTGTLLELAYVLETMNRGFLKKRPVVLYGEYWTPVLEPLKKELRDQPLDGPNGVISVARTSTEAADLLR